MDRKQFDMEKQYLNNEHMATVLNLTDFQKELLEMYDKTGRHNLTLCYLKLKPEVVLSSAKSHASRIKNSKKGLMYLEYLEEKRKALTEAPQDELLFKLTQLIRDEATPKHLVLKSIETLAKLRGGVFEAPTKETGNNTITIAFNKQGEKIEDEEE